MIDDGKEVKNKYYFFVKEMISSDIHDLTKWLEIIPGDNNNHRNSGTRQ